MARIGVWTIVLRASLVLVSAAAVAQRRTPITDPTQRLEFEGFSILPPSGKDWFIVEPRTVPDPSAKGALFGKVVGKMHSLYASANLYAPIATLTLEDVQSSVLEEAESNPRFKPLKAKASRHKCLGYDCVGIDLLFEDHAPRDAPGSVLMLSRQGFIVPHPGARGFYIWVEYSQRFPPGTKPYPLEAELESFLKSLAFTPIRDTERSLTDNFPDDCDWPSGETDEFSYGCEEAAYRMHLKKPGPVHVTRNFAWHARAVSVEVGAAVVSGRGTEPGAALLGIGCLTDESRGYLGLLTTAGGWEIARLDKDFTPLAGTTEPGETLGLGQMNRLRIVCAGERGKPTVVGVFVNGEKVGSIEDKQGYAPFNGVALYTDTFPGEVIFERLVAREPSEEDLRELRP